MREHAETFHANKGCKMAIDFFIPISPFSKKNFRVQYFKRYLNENVALYTPAFYIPYFHTSLHWIDWRLPMFSFHILTSVSVCIGVFRTQSNICDAAFCKDS